MHVVATAGHVDHGKSTLVRALTGMEPDRWAEERRRGMTIDLGYAWCDLPSGRTLGFVDVPGHERFVGNMLAGLGPAPAVLFVVAADEGWSRQSDEHLAAIDALDLRYGVLAVTRADLADPAPALADAAARLRRSSRGEVPAVAVSAPAGTGLAELRDALDRLAASLPPPDRDAPVRLWVDRVFTVHGSGTVVTGTLTAGTLRVGDELDVAGRSVRVRALHSLGTPAESVAAVARVGVNLRGAGRDELARGDALLSPGAWWQASLLDVRLGAGAGPLPAHLLLHAGTANVPVRVRPLGTGTARLALDRPLPLRAGDRALLRDPGSRRITAAVVLDADPPALRRRGAAALRAAELAAVGDRPDLPGELARRGAIREADAVRLGLPGTPPPDTVRAAGWLVTPERWAAWGAAVAASVDTAGQPRGVPAGTAARAAGLPDPALVGPVAAAVGLDVVRGHVVRPGDLGSAESAVRELERRLAGGRFDAPTRDELAALGLTPDHLSLAARSGRLVRLGDVVLLPDAPARAAALLARLPQPFTVGAAGRALGASRRVTVPLLEHLDAHGWTTRLDATHRTCRAAP